MAFVARQVYPPRLRRRIATWSPNYSTAEPYTGPPTAFQRIFRFSECRPSARRPWPQLHRSKAGAHRDPNPGGVGRSKMGVLVRTGTAIRRRQAVPRRPPDRHRRQLAKIRRLLSNAPYPDRLEKPALPSKSRLVQPPPTPGHESSSERDTSHGRSPQVSKQLFASAIGTARSVKKTHIEYYL